MVVAEAAPGRAAALGPIFRPARGPGVPALVFVNKIDQLDGRVRDTLAALQAQTRRKLVLRQVPIREGETVTGYVDVVSERAYRYRRGAASERIGLPAGDAEREAEARAELLEALADHDDALLEKVLEDLAPRAGGDLPRQLRKGEASGDVVSVLLGAAEHNNGVPAAVEGAAARRAATRRRPPPGTASRRRARRWRRSSAPCMPAMPAAVLGADLARPGEGRRAARRPPGRRHPPLPERRAAEGA